ncbi:adaptin ear-binding coat-associated protein 1 [Chrysochromulina tobinii]|uniref:Adaptin ear-binding coat-associated protein 1 n=1 Tax=Chrysochromulina tobinii TaxID=1460289 RepID=A0A0M0K9E0_9EUKA|nr:adaptin ear-binding coat-associated protein 1 [Chrysochromulina tobinii]|eukprot:KOO35008.1 adaptin ear-binding coat-associated protein 1 [Chrysochromulina sp. CCMP291]
MTIPPLKNESGHRANDWDVNKWLWSGALKVTATGSLLKIILYDPATGALFATCPVAAHGNKAVDQVIDSSRYFVLRLDDGKGRHAFIGMGFRDRSYAYDFNATMQDHWDGVRRGKDADEQAKLMAERAASEPMRDLSLKEGEKLNISINVPGAGSKPRAARPKVEGGAFSLPEKGGDADFGDFHSVSPKASSSSSVPPKSLAAPSSTSAALPSPAAPLKDVDKDKSSQKQDTEDTGGYFSKAVAFLTG